MKKEIQEIADLVGEQLSGVCFVQDYVELDFNGPILRSIADPLITGPSQEMKFPQPGSRDALCALIGRKVTKAKIQVRENLNLDFGEGYTFSIPLDSDHAQNGESAHFLPAGTASMKVW